METFSALLAFVREIHRSLVNSPHKGQWRILMFSLICAWSNNWANNGKAGDLMRHCAHGDVTLIFPAHCVERKRRGFINTLILEIWSVHHAHEDSNVILIMNKILIKNSAITSVRKRLFSSKYVWRAPHKLLHRWCWFIGCSLRN